jgi:hypothetical protein
MTQQKFIQNFSVLVSSLYELTEAYCHNPLSPVPVFLIEPSTYVTSDHLTAEENSYLKTWHKLKNKTLCFDEVVELLYRNGKVPLWANCTVYHAAKNKTVIKILFSRRFRSGDAVYYLDQGTGPFKAQVALPADYIQGTRFDVNWKKLQDDKKKNFITRLLAFAGMR